MSSGSSTGKGMKGTDEGMKSEIRRLRERLAANGVAQSPSYVQSPLHKRGRRSDSPVFSQVVGDPGFVLLAPPLPSSLSWRVGTAASGFGQAAGATATDDCATEDGEETAGDVSQDEQCTEQQQKVAVQGSMFLDQSNGGSISDDSIESFSSEDAASGTSAASTASGTSPSVASVASVASGTSPAVVSSAQSAEVSSAQSAEVSTKQTAPARRRNGSSKRRVWEDEATDEWLGDGKSVETVRKYRSHVDDLFEFLSTSSTPWYTHVTYLQLLAWRKHVIATASASTKQPRVAAVKSLFKALVQRRHIQENPAQHLKMPSKPPPSNVVRYVARQDVEVFKEACVGIENGLFAGAYYGMLRKKEVRKLRRKDCTFVQKEGMPELLRLHVFGKGRDEKERDVTLGVKGTELLRPFVMACAADDHYLFAGNQGPLTPLSSRQTGRRIKQVFKRIGLEKKSMHALRHAGASHSFDNGATLVELRDTLGHSDVKVTSRYLHTADDTAATRALDGKVSEVTEEGGSENEPQNKPPTAVSASDKKTTNAGLLRKELEGIESMFRDELISEREKNHLRQKAFDDNQ